MTRKLSKDVNRHIHRDQVVTDQKLKRFALDTREIQLAVLSELRKRNVEDNVELPIAAIALAVVLPFVSIFTAQQTSPEPHPLWAVALTVFVFVLGATLVVALVFGLGPLLRHSKRVDAAVWLPAFEEELERRRNMAGRRARAWRRVH